MNLNREGGPIVNELKRHAPFTFFGALTGIVIMAVFYRIPYRAAYDIFYTLHPMHVFLSALVTASMYEKYRSETGRKWYKLASLVVIGITGSVGVATLSDSVMPYLGELLLGMPHAEPHIGFIEKWWLIFPLAVAGIVVAYFWPRTRFPHAGHVLISTWASLFHIIMAEGKTLSLFLCVAVLFFLFFAVWIPCCISDIVFPLLFVDRKNRPHFHT